MTACIQWMEDETGIVNVLAAAVRKARKGLGLSQEDLAPKAGLDRTYVSQVERGARNCTIIVLARLAKALKTTAERLLVSPKAAHWPDANAEGERTRSSAWSKWFGRYPRSTCGVADTTKVFHSFRHTFKRVPRDAGIPEEMHDALTGHSGGGVGRSYGKGFSLKPLAKAMDEVLAPTDLRQLSWSKPNG